MDATLYLELMKTYCYDSNGKMDIEKYKRFKEIYPDSVIEDYKFDVKEFVETVALSSAVSLGIIGLAYGGYKLLPYMIGNAGSVLNNVKNFTYTEYDKYGDIIQQYSNGIDDGKYIDIFHTENDTIIVDTSI